ncbi:MAG TPA: hypothetical protein VLC46_26135 [Thermoanaerobaculia bacterium]|jgi:hypothetical protein|nr:hypothetical protein [Thermoanaerobaculia bacterium]
MATPLSFTLQLPPLMNQQNNDSAGNWQYVGTTAVDSFGELVQLVAMKRENAAGSVSFAASMLTATIMYPSQGGGVPPNLTIQGVHDLNTNNETGSVSSASSELAAYIGGTFSFDAKAGVLTVFPGS